MIGAVVLCHHQDPQPVIDRLISLGIPGRNIVVAMDRSPEVKEPFETHVVHNTSGTGFLAGRMRNIGAAYARDHIFDTEGLLFLDGDRIPNALPENHYVVTLYRGEVDGSREALGEDITQECRHPYSPFYSAGMYLPRAVLDDLDWEVHDPDFDGTWGWEDSYLGDVIVSKGYSVLLPNGLRVSGELCEPSWVLNCPDIGKDPKFRNWHLRLKKRKELPGLIQETEVLRAMATKHICIPQAEFDKIASIIQNMPYHAAKPIVDIIEKHAVTADIDLAPVPAAQEAADGSTSAR